MSTAEVVSIDFDRPVPLPVLARFLNLTERRITQLAKEGIVTRSGRGQYPLAQSVRGYVTFLQQTASGMEGIDPDKLEPFKRKAHYLAEAEKLNLEKQRGELVPRIEVEQEQGRIAKIVNGVLETATDILERDAGLTPKQAHKLQESIDRLREQIAHELTSDNDASDVRASA